MATDNQTTDPWSNPIEGWDAEDVEHPLDAEINTATTDDFLGRPQTDDPSLHGVFPQHNGAAFLTPTELTVSPLAPRRAVLIGSCLLEEWGFHRKNPSNCPVDHVLVMNAGQMPETPAFAIDSYDFAVIQVPLRVIYHDVTIAALNYDSPEAYEQAFQQACERLATHLKFRMQWNIQHGLLTFVANFLPPQRNPMGVLFPRFDLRNPEYYVTRLNEHLESLVRSYKNAYVLDIDRIAASIGRRRIQDDIIAQSSHGATARGGRLTDRMEPVAALGSHFDLRERELFFDSVWSELIAMFRVVRQADAIKLVVVDLDDTLWRGVSGDIADVDAHMVVGWPLGVAEALRYLKKRGILLAIVSKNEESRIRQIWPRLFRGDLALSDFAAIKINWLPKTQNMQELLEGINLLPRNVLFIDDNPVERAAMKDAFPDMRVIGRHPYYLRQTLLWSTETQVPFVTAESSKRTEMVHAQLEREGERRQLSREDFLRQAAPRISMGLIDSVDHDRFPRAFELLNKTNQYNTTGRRWTRQELAAHFRAGAVLHTFEVEDIYTAYGLVGVVIVCGSMVDQWVMSCRVLGYQVENAVMAVIVQGLRERGAAVVRGRLIETNVNFPCRELFGLCGFIQDGDWWTLAAEQMVEVPEHVTVEI
jgi:FkbH-like protein